MNNQFELLKAIAPEMVSVVKSRFDILTEIEASQPIGRRALSLVLSSTERIIRKEAGILKDIGLIDFTAEGMFLTELGDEVLKSLKNMLGHFEEIKRIEDSLEKHLGIRKVILAEASDKIISQAEEKRILGHVGKLASEYIKSILKPKSIIGLAGGSTVHSVVENFKMQKNALEGITVIPARGGIGIRAEYQANTLVEKLANKLGAKYQVLYTPDILAKETIEKLKSEPQVKEIIDKIEDIDILVFGVGQALQMAETRSLAHEEKSLIEDAGAVSEAFGYYFDKDSNIVHEINTIGVELEQFKKLDNLIAVACGIEKAEAIKSISKLNSNLVLVTDERVARAILKQGRN